MSGGEEARTPDLYSAIVALSQLSYTPICSRYATYYTVTPPGSQGILRPILGYFRLL
jgi:hypothetical protein